MTALPPYGFGTLPAQIQVRALTFSFEEIYQQARNLINQRENPASTRYLTILFYRFGESAAIEHRSAPVIAHLSKLFNRARKYTTPPEQELYQIAHARINSFLGLKTLKTNN